MDKEFTDFGILFQNIICDLKVSYPLWEDLIKQGGKFHSTLRLALAGMASFLESFQKLSDFAMEAKGGPKDLGSSMIKLCLRHKALENHIKLYNNSLMECLVVPLQERIDEWRKSTIQLEKDHGKESKKMQGEVKKASLETVKLQKKVNKGKPDAKNKLDLCVKEYTAKASALEFSERNAVISVIAEHRGRFSFLVGCIKPLVTHETAMIGELESFKDIMGILESQTMNQSGMVEQTYFDVLHGFNMTMERKKRSVKEEAEPTGTMSRSSSLCSQKSSDALKVSESHSSNNNHQQQHSSYQHHETSSTLSRAARAPMDDVQCPPVVTMTVDDGFFFQQEFAAAERAAKTMSRDDHQRNSLSSASYLARPNITADTFVPPPAVQQQQMQQQFVQQSRQQSFPSTTSLSSTSSGMSNSSGSKKVEKIYARPALVKRENSVIAPVFVAPPVVPDLPGFKPQSKNDSGVSTLNQAIIDLEKNSKLLESSHPCPTMSLQSLQSLQSMQCSSGYGTMTNINSNSNETLQSIAELDALLETSLSDLEKCCTLPIKRYNYSKVEGDNRRPVSSSDEVPSSSSSNRGGGEDVWRLKNEQTAFQKCGTQSDELPPPPDDFLLSSPPKDGSFPPPPSSCLVSHHHHPLPPPHHHHHHQEYQLPSKQSQQQQQQRELNAVLVQRFSRQPHQNSDDSLPESRLFPEVRGGRNSLPPPDVHQGCHRDGPGASQPEASDFSMLLRGVSLRKTTMNDRSAPMLKKK